jgi:hypothetical protein
MVLLLPLIFLFIRNGSITFHTEARSEPAIRRILAPPEARERPVIDFDRSFIPERTTRLDFEAFSAERDRRADSRDRFRGAESGAAETYLPAPSRPAAGEDPRLRVEEAEQAAARGSESGAAATPPSAEKGLLDPRSLAESASAGERPAGPSLRRGAALSGTGASAGAAEDGGVGAVHLDPGADGSQTVAEGSGAGVPAPRVSARRTELATDSEEEPDSEKRQLIDWILAHAAPLPAAVAVALEEDPLKGDRTAKIELADATGGVYEIYLLHRNENDLVRLLAVRGDLVWRLDLPERRLAADHVQAGEVMRADFGGRSPAARTRAPIVEVALRSIERIPTEAREVLELVRSALMDRVGRDGGR